MIKISTINKGEINHTNQNNQINHGSDDNGNDMRAGWEIKKLGEIIQLEYGKPLPDSKRKLDGKYPIYGANGEKGRTNEFYHDERTIIVGRKGSAGEINFTEKKFWPLDVTYFITYDTIQYDLDFLFYLLTLLELTRLAKGVKPGINRNEVYDINVTVPLLPEQKRIVEILNEAFAAIDKAKANVEKNLHNAKQLFESYLQNVFSVKSNDWQEKTFKEVCELVGGSQPSKNDFIYEPKEGYIRLIQVRDYRTSKFITYIPKAKAKRFCTKSDIMIGRYGPPIFGIFKGLEGSYNVALMKAKVNEKLCDQDYFFWFLKTNKLRQFVEKSSKRAAGQDGVRKELLDKYPVPVPSLKGQEKIVRNIEVLKNETQKLETLYQQKLNDLEELKKSILQKAFNGELTAKEVV